LFVFYLGEGETSNIMCGFSVVKYLLFIFNFIFWLAGAALTGLAIYIRVDEDLGNAVEIAGISFYTGSDILLATGAVMLLVGFFGCCGAIKESACLLGLYFTCLLLVFGVEVGIGVWAFVNFNSIEEVITETIGNVNATEYNYQMTIQQTFKCCGTNVTCGAFPSNVPQNCECNEPGNAECQPISNITGCVASGSLTSSTLIYAEPCSTVITNFIDSNITLLGGVALGIGLAEILGMMVSLWLCCKIRDKDHDF